MNHHPDKLFQAALVLAPAFRDKFDFSNEADYAKLADYAFKAAAAMLDRDAIETAKFKAAVVAQAKEEKK